jgi:succinate dehydrogenase/fumarate reductase cytochrome b subunit
MNKIRQWDNICARWMMRHFYIIFFEFVLVIIFFVFFFNTLHSIDISTHISTDNTVEQILMQQVTNTHIIIVLLLLNSFWTLFIFNGLNRIRLLLKDIGYGLTRRRSAKP